MDTRRRAPGPGTFAPGAAVRFEAEPPASLVQGLFQSDQYLRQIVETLDHTVFLTDAGLTSVAFINAAYDRIWGRPRAELFDDPMAFMEGVHPDDRERLRKVLTSSPGSGYETEFRVVRPDGELRWVLTRGFPVRDADGTIAWIAGIAEDTTDHKRVLESHEQLVRGFTHDLKNPLGSADGHLALLLEGVYGALTSAQAESIGRARRSIRTALDLVAQLLDIERARSGTIDLHRSSFDLGDVLRDLIHEYQPVAGVKGIELSLTLPTVDPASLMVYSDSTRVRQIVGNLVSNAVKYTQPGGSCSVHARFVEATGAPPFGPWLAIAVSDNGPGIPLEKQHLLFREFTRFSPNAADGSGIGLAISQQLARALDARLTFESQPGVGSTFTCWLPKDRRAPAP